MNDFDGSFSESTSASADIKQYLYLLWQWAWLVVLVAGIAGVGAFFYSRSQTPIYQAVTTILINESSANRMFDSTAILWTSERLISTYAEMLTKQPIRDEVARNLGLDQITGSITVQNLRDTQLMTVTVEDSDPLRAAAIANETVRVFSSQITDMQSSRYLSSKENLQNQMIYLDQQITESSTALEKQIQQNILELQKQNQASGAEATLTPVELENQARLINQTEIDQIESRLAQYRQIYASVLSSYEQIRLSEAQTSVNFLQIEEAVPNLVAIRPQILRNSLLAAMVGMMLAIGGIFAVEFFDDSVKDPDALTRLTGLPILAMITRHNHSDGKPVTQTSPRSPVSEAFRTLRTNVQFAGVDNPLRLIMVTSPTPQDGKTTVSSNFAISIAQTGKTVTLVDADMRRPRIHDSMGVQNVTGLSDMFLKPFLSMNGHAQKTETEGLTVISCGKTPPNPSELLGSNRMKEILSGIKMDSDVIVIDTPPVLSVTDATVLSAFVDGVILVVKPGFTRQSAVLQTVAQLRQANARILGLVFNDVNARKSRYYYYKSYYHYSSYYANDQEDKNGRQKKEKA